MVAQACNSRAGAQESGGSLGPTGSLCLMNQRVSGSVSVVAIPGCQLDYMWNELQSRIGRLTYDPNLEAQRYKFLTWT